MNTPLLSLDALKLLAEHGLLRTVLRKILMTSSVEDEPLSEDQRKRAMLEFAQKRGLQNPKEMEGYCLARLLTRKSLSRNVELQTRVQQHSKKNYIAKAEAHFLRRKLYLDKVIYRLIRVNDEGLARELYLQLLEEGKSFSDLAKQHSKGPEKETLGVVGPVSLGQAHPLLVQRLRTIKAGVLQEPFQIEPWWLLVKLETFRPAIFDEDMALQMSIELYEDWLEEQVDRWVHELTPSFEAKTVQLGDQQ